MNLVSDADRLLNWSRSLGLVDRDATELWVDKFSDEYCSLRKSLMQFVVDSSNVDLNLFNPLSKVRDGNPWTAQFDNQNLLKEIKLDVDRTYQELPYRQGMNDLVAIIFYAVTRGLPDAGRDTYEGVAYALFVQLMVKLEHANMFYPTAIISPHHNPSKQSPLLNRCDRIFQLLEKKDFHLHKHLIVREISPNLFLLRWIRLLFAREFGFAQIFHVWDFLFSDIGNWHEGVDYFAISMIIHMRKELLSSDNAGCFTTLLNYPEIEVLDSLFGLSKTLRNNSPQQPAPLVAPVTTRREKILIELMAVIDDLKRSGANQQIKAEIRRLENIANIIRNPNQ